MSRYRPFHRFELFDTDDTTTLVPAAGAPHSDPFKVEDRRNPSAGYQPYLGKISGRRGTMDLIEKSSDQGEMIVRLFDQKLRRGFLHRWGSAFFADAKGRMRGLGLLGQISLSTDGGRTFTVWWAGRVQSIKRANSYGWLDLVLRDISHDLDIDIFIGQPHSNITYAHSAIMLPNGFISGQGTYAGFPTTSKADYNVFQKFGAFGLLTFQGSGGPSDQNTMSPGFIDALGTPDSDKMTQFGPQQRQLDWSEGDFFGQGSRFGVWIAGGRLNLRSLRAVEDPATGSLLVTVLGVSELLTRGLAPNTGHTDYVALPSQDTAVTVYITWGGRMTKNVRFYVDDVHPMAFFRDLLDGEFSELAADGSTLWSIPYDATAFTNLIADTTIPDIRFIAEETWRLNEFVEKQLLKPFHLGYRIEGNTVVPIDMRLPSTISNVTPITDEMRDERVKPSWSYDRNTVVTGVEVSTYRDILVTDDRAPQRVIAAKSGPVRIYNPDTAARLGQRVIKLDAKTLRSAVGDLDQAQQRDAVIEGHVMRYWGELRGPFGNGAPITTLTLFRDTVLVDNLREGDLTLVEVDGIFDPATYILGGTRLCWIKSIEFDGLLARVTIQDVGENVVIPTPTLGTLGLETGNNLHGVTVPVTVASGTYPVQLDAAVTATSESTRPVEGSPLWVTRAIVDASETAVLRQFTSSVRVWVRGKSIGVEGAFSVDRLVLPSVWVFPAGTGRIDTTALGTPTSLSITPTPTIFLSSDVRAHWTNDDDTRRIELATAKSPPGTRTIRTIIAAGQTQLIINQYIVANTTYFFSVRHLDDLGGVGPWADSSDFTIPSGWGGGGWPVPTIAFA